MRTKTHSIAIILRTDANLLFPQGILQVTGTQSVNAEGCNRGRKAASCWPSDPHRRHGLKSIAQPSVQHMFPTHDTLQTDWVYEIERGQKPTHNGNAACAKLHKSKGA